MAIINFPTTLRVAQMTWGINRQDVVYRGLFGSQAMGGGAPLWSAALTFDLLQESESGAYQSLVMTLEGMKNNLALHNIGRPEPLGTLRGTRTINGAVVVGATSMSVNGTASATLKAGDFLGVGTGHLRQVLMVTGDVTFAGSTATVQFMPALRSGWPDLEPLTWDKPTALFRQQAKENTWAYSTVTVSSLSLDLLEDYRL